MRMNRGDDERISRIRGALVLLKAITEKSLSRLAREANFHPSTLTRFMSDQSSTILRASTLRSIIECQLAYAYRALDSDHRQMLDRYEPSELSELAIQPSLERYLELQRMFEACTADGFDMVAMHASSPTTLLDVKYMGGPTPLPVISAVEAGVFREAVAWPQDEWRLVSYPNKMFAEDVFGLEVRGDSMDRRFPAGTILICRRHDPEIDDVPIGRYVIAHRSGVGPEFEATVKRLERTPAGGYALHPESTNAVHAAMALEDLGEQSVEISAVVVGAVIKY